MFLKKQYAVFGLLFPSEEKSNNKTDGKDMPPLETQEEAEKRQSSLPTIPEENEQEGDGLKIMTPNQLLTRLPILLAQKKAGNKTDYLFFVQFKKFIKNNI